MPPTVPSSFPFCGEDSNDFKCFKTSILSCLNFLFISSKKAARLNKKVHPKIVEAKDFATGIENYRKENHIDLITVFSHSHSALYNLFNENNTKIIAFRSKIPVMSIHE